MLKENVDYELIPSDDPEDDAWSVRILKGDFVETVFQYGAIKLNGEDLDDDSTQMTFNFELKSSPIYDLSENNVELQKHVGDILLSVLEDAIQNKQLLTQET